MLSPKERHAKIRDLPTHKQIFGLQRDFEVITVINSVTLINRLGQIVK